MPSFCFCHKNWCTDGALYSFQHNGNSIWKWMFVIFILIFLQGYYNTSLYLDNPRPFKYPKNLSLRSYNSSIITKHKFENQGDQGRNETPTYTVKTPVCKLNLSTLGPISISKTILKLVWVEKQYPDVEPGGFYSPPQCNSRHKVAILVPYRNRENNLAIFLYHIHQFLQKQLLEYRIFVIEQFGTHEFNKGSLYNIGFLESQRFGEWECLVFHDVDLLPLDQRILYSCPRKPTHMSSAVESHGYELPYLQLFGGVTAMTVAQFDMVNGYSNLYQNWGGEDDDMFKRLQARRYPVLRYNKSIGRYATLPHKPNQINYHRWYTLSLTKRRFRTEGLRNLQYKVITITKRRLFTHILAVVNP